MADRQRIDADIPLAAVVGDPVSHSLSPEIFRFLSRESGRPVDYRRLALKPEELRSSFRAVSRIGLFRGWNVTIPHKTMVARLVSDLDESARRVGAVNVVRFDGPARATGFNTDVLGVRETLAGIGFRPRGRTAVIYGAGGAALAVGAALGDAGAREVVLACRDRARGRAAARRLAAAFAGTRFTVTAWDSAPQGAALYVNATPIGMVGFAGCPPLPERLPRGSWAFDVVYRPRDTEFLREARRRGARGVDGLEMLGWQAIASWEIWFGRLRGRRETQRRLIRHLGRHLAQDRMRPARPTKDRGSR